MQFRKPELIPLLFIIAAVLVTGGLGVWQLERLEWKETLVADIAKAQSEPALTTLPSDMEALAYRKVELSGQFVKDKTLRKVGGKQGKGTGFFILTPFKLKDGRVILVNRGFLPDGKEAGKLSSTVEGVLRTPHEKRLFILPDNQPEKNLWLYEDLTAMSKATGATLLPLIVEATGAREKDIYPIPSDGKITLRNDHRNYAITWFALMLIALVMFAVYHRVPEKKS